MRAYLLAFFLAAVLSLFLGASGCQQIETMSPRGFPDWNVETGALGGFDADVAESAARLGALNVFNRLGKTAMWDDFRDDINAWGTNGSGTGFAIDRHTALYYFHPGASYQ